jgi:AraC family transcriptional regulator
MDNKNHLLNAEYISRINKTFDYIEGNLGNQFTLADLASVANFSKFHFHRIFQGITGETPFQFILRVRLERAASLLTGPDSITEIAIKCGFSDISVFSRNFKNYFKISATNWRTTKCTNSNLSQTLSNVKQDENISSLYFCPETKTIKWRTKMKTNKSVEVKELPKMTVAYIRHIGPYKGNDNLFRNLWDKLFAWAGPRGLLSQKDLKSLVTYHDDPNIASEDKLRLSVCISVPENTKVDGEVGKMVIEGGKYVVARFELGAGDFQEAWEWVYGHWLPTSGYQPDDKVCFEMYPEEPKDNKFIVDICVPVKPL